jgi:glycosyltransferase involved in cell wall biosynthesis
LIVRCLRSLVRSVNLALREYRAFDLSLTVLDDHSSPEAVRDIQAVLASAEVPVRFLTLRGTGNGESLKENYEYAREHCPDLIYFCEDDYLHDPAAVTEMLQTYDLLAPVFPGGLAMHPYDCPDRYYSPYPHGQYPARIYLGSTRYWRTLLHTTGTFVVSNRTLREHYHHYMAFTRYGIDPTVSEDSSVNLVYREVPCLSPLPSLAVHLQYVQTLSPFVNWQSWWEAAAG